MRRLRLLRERMYLNYERLFLCSDSSHIMEYHQFTVKHLKSDPCCSEYINGIREELKYNIKKYVKVFRYAFMILTQHRHYNQNIIQNPSELSNIRICMRYQNKDKIETYIVCVFEPKPNLTSYETIYDYNMNVYDYTTDDIKRFNKTKTIIMLYTWSLAIMTMFFLSLLLWISFDYFVYDSIDGLGVMVLILTSFMLGLIFGRMSSLNSGRCNCEGIYNRI